MTDEKPLITANLKIAALLDAYPQLEQVLVDLAPPFRKLRHPVLRRTVARVTSLAQAAKVAGVPLDSLVRTLRHAVGQSAEGLASDASPTSRVGLAEEGSGPVPDWVRQGEVVAVLDADAILGTGEHPLKQVQERLADLGACQLLAIEGSFRPEPLIDLLRSQGRSVHVSVEGAGRFRTYVGRGEA